MTEVAQPPLDELRRWDPEQIGPYTVLGRLGAGAMGQVYLGRSMAGRLVAVKTIKIEFAEEPGFRSRFGHEVAAARRVSGAFTAAVIAADAEADVPWLATAYIPAPSLDRLVRACGPLPVPAIKWLAAGCAEALESIHTAGLIHRDLKPSNVLVSPDGPRVIDFGLARATERIQLTVTRGTAGTPAYMAPEQARDTRQASIASDMFSLGATLAFAATGHPPYQGETVMDILVRLATEPPDLAGLPPELTGVVGSCLERSPRDRPTSAALLAQLGQFAEATSGGPGSSHTYLTGPALAMVTGYQRSPQRASTDAAGEGSSDDATLGSRPSVPGLASRWRGQRARKQRRRAGGFGARPPRAQHLVITSAAAAGAVVLVGLGVLAGAKLGQPGGKTAPAPSSTPALPGGGFPPQPSPVPTSLSSTPQILLNQPFGDGNTGFVIHGSGWPPGTSITVRLAGVGTSPFRPVADRVGTFNYTINEAHEFFHGPIPDGLYRVVVTGLNGIRNSVTFRVSPGPPPGAPPPGGSPPPQ